MIYILGHDKPTGEPRFTIVINRRDLVDLTPPIHRTLDTKLNTIELGEWVHDRGAASLDDLLSRGLTCHLIFCDVETNEQTAAAIREITG